MVFMKGTARDGVGNCKRLSVPACDTEPADSGGLGFVDILGTSCMPVPSGYWHTFNLARNALGKLRGTSVSQRGGALS